MTQDQIYQLTISSYFLHVFSTQNKYFLEKVSLKASKRLLYTSNKGSNVEHSIKARKTPHREMPYSLL